MAQGFQILSFIKIGNKNFFDIKDIKVFDVFKLKLGNFQIDLRGRESAGHPSKCQSIITIGLNLTLHMVIRVASQPPPSFSCYCIAIFHSNHPEMVSNESWHLYTSIESLKTILSSHTQPKSKQTKIAKCISRFWIYRAKMLNMQCFLLPFS